ncbi:MAG: DUF927 domain-containing protein [Deltaproteobacteria bacterium]|nr:DUF927 domain-containing protein [Deltaproteobacteria bacterium]
MSAPARLYIKQRGINVATFPDALKFHPGLTYTYDNKIIGRFPAIVAKVTEPNGKDFSIHRIFITQDGKKAPVPEPKKSLGRMKERAVWFAQASNEVSAAEGIETALAVFQTTSMPTVSCISATGMKTLLVPENIQTVHIWADKDCSGAGEDAAMTLAEKLVRQGKTVYIHSPPMPIPEGKKGVDWLDELNTHGATKFLASLEETAPVSINGLNGSKKLFGVAASFDVRDGGVYYQDEDKAPQWICSRLDIVGETRSEKGTNWGRLLRFKDNDGRFHEWAMPMSLLAGDGNEYRAHLLNLGLQISPGSDAKKKLSSYIQVFKALRKITCVDRVGWHDKQFVLPDCTIGCSKIDEQVLLQSAEINRSNLRAAGTLIDWQEVIAKKCIDNSRLIFAVCTAFAGPLLKPTNHEGGGFHYRGVTSIGKTTALRIAGSVCGGGEINGYLNTWRTTANAIEAVAAQHCDLLLLLDEIHHVEPKIVGEVAYLLANGCGKSRLNRSVQLQRPMEWRLLFLSSGEASLAEYLCQAGIQVRGGQETRMVDIPADAGFGHGLFENLHGFPDGCSFSDHLNQASKKFYGTPLRQFLALFCKENEWAVIINDMTNAFVSKQVPLGTSGEIHRVATRFGLVASSGELATKLGICPWKEGDASLAASVCFKAWIASRGGYDCQDTMNGIAQVRAFLQEFGTARFPIIAGTGVSDEGGIRRAGFRRVSVSGDTEWLIFNEVFKKEVCKGFNPRAVARALKERNYLWRDSDGKCSRPERLPGLGKVRVYCIRSSIMEEGVSGVSGVSGVPGREK